MKFTLELECNNAAFEHHPNLEIARILVTLASEVRESSKRNVPVLYRLRDVNGNTVGEAAWTEGD